MVQSTNIQTEETVDPLEPIAGISLEQYAELSAKMSNCGGDLEVCAQIAAANGVDRATWEAAMNGWNARMYDPSTASAVVMAYYPLHQAAMKQFAPPPPEIAYEQYVTMYATVMKKGEQTMFDTYNVTPQQWSQISGEWVGKLTSDKALADKFTKDALAEMDRIAAG
ncbi:MAG: hypothetical protein JST22_17855 [Bacteroidetes bacterium]|nr:hypothetical protein [Bacteroidota bacterium]